MLAGMAARSMNAGRKNPIGCVIPKEKEKKPEAEEHLGPISA